jgi:hypothetical protein
MLYRGEVPTYILLTRNAVVISKPGMRWTRRSSSHSSAQGDTVYPPVTTTKLLHMVPRSRLPFLNCHASPLLHLATAAEEALAASLCGTARHWALRTTGWPDSSRCTVIHVRNPREPRATVSSIPPVTSVLRMDTLLRRLRGEIRPIAKAKNPLIV